MSKANGHSDPPLHIAHPLVWEDNSPVPFSVLGDPTKRLGVYSTATVLASTWAEARGLHRETCVEQIICRILNVWDPITFFRSLRTWQKPPLVPLLTCTCSDHTKRAAQLVIATALRPLYKKATAGSPGEAAPWILHWSHDLRRHEYSCQRGLVPRKDGQSLSLRWLRALADELRLQSFKSSLPSHSRADSREYVCALQALLFSAQRVSLNCWRKWAYANISDRAKAMSFLPVLWRR